MRRNPTPPVAHGTRRGYQQHYRQGLPMCGECREAHRLYKQERKIALRAACSRKVAVEATPMVLRVKSLQSAEVTAEWELYQRMINSPDDWQRIYWEAVSREPISASESISDRVPLIRAL